MNKKDLALKNLEGLIYQKTQPTTSRLKSPVSNW